MPWDYVLSVTTKDNQPVAEISFGLGNFGTSLIGYCEREWDSFTVDINEPGSIEAFVDFLRVNGVAETDNRKVPLVCHQSLTENANGVVILHRS